MRTDLGLQIQTVIDAPDADLHAPSLCDVEVCSALRGIIRRGEIETDRAQAALSAYLQLPITKHGHGRLIGRIFELRDNFTASDAAYVALAEQLGGTLVTCDGRMTRAVRGLLPLNVVGVTA